MNAQQMRQTVITMLAAETGCEPTQLTDGKIHIVTRKPERRSLAEHRRFNPHPGRIAAVTLGTGAVVSVEPEDLAWAENTFTTTDRDELFRGKSLADFIQRGIQDGLIVHGPFPRFTAPLSAIAKPEYAAGYTVKLVDIEGEYARNTHIIDRSKFTNSLFPEPGVSGRPTVFAAVAERAGEIVGIAGVSKDSEFMYQIGIDVLPRHRGNGLAPAMTASAARAVFGAGALPYYGTSNTNIASMSTAIAAELRPTWVEVLTRPA